jgi:hypothetical protein
MLFAPKKIRTNRKITTISEPAILIRNKNIITKIGEIHGRN